MSPCPSYVPACAGLYTARVRPRAPSAAASAAVAIVLPTSVSVPGPRMILGGGVKQGGAGDADQVLAQEGRAEHGPALCSECLGQGGRDHDVLSAGQPGCV